jgi:hypothetical protein
MVAASEDCSRVRKWSRNARGIAGVIGFSQGTGRWQGGSPVILPTLKYATQKHYQYMLDAHLIPAFGNSQLRALTREELQCFLSRKLEGGLSWETVHHFKCGLSKILGAAVRRQLFFPLALTHQNCY